MQIDYTVSSFEALAGLVNYIESVNTKGAGLRWLSKFEHFLSKQFHPAASFHLCRTRSLKRLDLNCIYYKDWIIAFSVSGNSILIEAILHKSRVID